VTTHWLRLLNTRLPELGGRQTGRTWSSKLSGDDRRASARSYERTEPTKLGCSLTLASVTWPLSPGREPPSNPTRISSMFAALDTGSVLPPTCPFLRHGIHIARKTLSKFYCPGCGHGKRSRNNRGPNQIKCQWVTALLKTMKYTPERTEKQTKN